MRLYILLGFFGSSYGVSFERSRFRNIAIFSGSRCSEDVGIVHGPLRARIAADRQTDRHSQTDTHILKTLGELPMRSTPN